MKTGDTHRLPGRGMGCADVLDCRLKAGPIADTAVLILATSRLQVVHRTLRRSVGRGWESRLQRFSPDNENCCCRQRPA